MSTTVVRKPLAGLESLGVNLNDDELDLDLTGVFCKWVLHQETILEPSRLLLTGSEGLFLLLLLKNSTEKGKV